MNRADTAEPAVKTAFVGIESPQVRTALKHCLAEAGHTLIQGVSGPPDIIITKEAHAPEAMERSGGRGAVIIGVKELEGTGIPFLWGDEVCDAYLPPQPEPAVYIRAVEIARKRREDAERAGEDRRALEKIRGELETGERARAALLETIPAAVYFKNTDLEYVTANKTFSQWTGVPLDKIPGRTDHDFFPWETAEKFRLDDTEVIVKGGIKSNIDEIIAGTEGEKRWVSTSKTPFRDTEGRIIGMVGISIDITLRKRMENVLRELTACILGFTPNSNENIRSLLFLSRDLLSADFGMYLRKSGEEFGIAFQTEGGGHADVYTGFCKTLAEWNEEDRTSDLLYIPDLTKIPEELEMERWEPVVNEYGGFLGRRIEIGEDDEAFLCCFFKKGYELNDTDSRVIHLAASAAGIEEQRRLSEEQVQLERNRAEAASRAKSEFLAHMSHEFKTPLNGILGYAQILKKGPENKEQFEHGLDVIERGANHLSKLIEDILDLSKIEAGKITVRPVHVAVKEFLTDISTLFEPKIAGKGLQFGLEVGAGVPSVIKTDEKRLRQVLLNLLSNAVKYTESGLVRLSVQSRGERIRFTVEDTGCGIPRGEIESVFSPFVQLQRPGKLSEGTGLGLYISKRILEEMGSSVMLESIPGEGSRFWFELPHAGTEGNKTKMEKEEQAQTEPRRSREPQPRRVCGPAVKPRNRRPGSKEDLELLYRLVNVGDIGEIRTTVNRLLAEGDLDREFAQTLVGLCGKYNIEKLKAYIIKYLR